MLRPWCKITFTKESGKQYIFDFINEFETDESFEQLTQTFKITLPTALNFEGVPLFSGSNAVFKRGDRVKVEAGYFPQIRTIFEGWVANISAKIPVVITCEDDMFLMKNTRVSYPDESQITRITVSKKKGRPLKRPKVISPKITLKQLLNNIIPDDIPFECIDVNLGQFRASNVSVSQILDKLQDDYGIYSRFINGVLYSGFQSNAADTNTEIFEFERNIIDDSGLEWQEVDDVFIKVKVISINDNNEKTEVEVGDADGAQRTYHLYNSDKKSMTEYANTKLKESKYTGYHGSFMTFGEPYVRPGDIAKMVSKRLPERDGQYLIPSVKRTFGMSGYRQDIEIRNKLA
jgi:hypothetical protein